MSRGALAVSPKRLPLVGLIRNLGAGPLWYKLADSANLMTFCFVSGKDYHNSLSGLGLCPKQNFEGTRGESSSYTRGENGLFTDEFIEELEIRNERS